MKLYEVLINRQESIKVKVKAKNKEDAKLKAMEQDEQWDVFDSDFMICAVEEVKP